MHRLLVALLLYSGCAFGIDGPDPNRPRSKPPQCDTSKSAVVLDGAVAVTAGIIAMSLLESEPAIALLPASIGAIYLGGALKGNSNANKCRAAMGEYESYVAARETVEEQNPGRLHRREPQEPAEYAKPQATAAGSVAVAPPATAVAPSPTAAAAVAPPPAPVPAQPAKAQAARPQPAAPPEADAGADWSAFWREVP